MVKNVLSCINKYPFVILLFLLTACNSAEKQPENLVEYQLVNPLIIDTVYVNEYAADIHSLQNVEIRARVKGYLEAIYVDEGKHVKAGQKLFSISCNRYKEELLKAKAFLKSAIAEAKSSELELKNIRLLVDKNVVSIGKLEIGQSNLDAANARVEVAKSNESSAVLNLSLTDIRAPFDGIINRIPNKTGSLINEETLLTTLSNNKEVFAYFNVSEREYLDIASKKGAAQKTEVSLVLANNTIYPIKGTIETVEGEFDKTTGNIAFRARFSNPDELLKNGSSGKIQLKAELKNALIIPQKSTFEIQDKIYVFVVDKNNIAQMRLVKPRLRLRFLYVIASGLKPDDRIVYEGIQQIKDGDKIISELVLLRDKIAAESK
ncbi:MAG: efflux RND transporter periplasmic adaptor subunit [Bacteroidota bacterium]|nr:efflux RND transporter periplasmic adaptor subunit [Bacteroidota bacterium]